MVTIIDYGMGNLRSVQKACELLGEICLVSGEKEQILNATRLILPGVGAFSQAAECLKRNGLDEAIIEAANRGTPILGICLGMQLLFAVSHEGGVFSGLGLIPGEITRFNEGVKCPHMGWNSITVNKNSRILKNIGSEPYVYFVHSYYVNAEDESIISAYTEYGQKLDIAVEKDNVFATQFHPEKSGETGMTILKNFIAL